MYRCVAPNCKMRTYNLSQEQLQMAKNNYIVSFHKFPDDPDRRKSWIEAAGKKDWNPPNYSSLCSLHFKDDCFSDTNELSDSAFPTIFFSDFRSHIKKIVDDFEFQCGSSSENEDDEKNVESTPKSDSEDDFNVVECEEIMVVDEDEDEDDKSNNPTAFNDRKKTPLKSVQKKPTGSSPRLSSTSTNRIKKSLNESFNKPDPISAKLSDSIVKKKSIVQPKKDSTEPLRASKPFANSVLQLVNSITSTDNDELSDLPISPASTTVPKPATETVITDTSSNVLVSETERTNIKDTSVVPTSTCSSSSSARPQLVSGSVENTSNSNPPLTDSERIKLLNQTFSTVKTSSTTKEILNTLAVTSELENLANKIPTLKVKTGKPDAFNEKHENVKTVVLIHNVTIDTTTKPYSEYSVVNQLLKVVNLATAKSETKDQAAIYLVTSKANLSNEIRQPKVICLEPSEIIQIIVVIIQGIKRGTTQLTKKIVLLSSNPAIFLLKNVSIKNCDSGINCVYIITNENLTPFMAKLKETNRKFKNVVKEPDRPATSKILNEGNKLQTVSKTVECPPTSAFTSTNKTKVSLNPVTSASISSISSFRNTCSTVTRTTPASSPRNMPPVTRTNQSLTTKPRLVSGNTMTRTNISLVSSPRTTSTTALTRTIPSSTAVTRTIPSSTAVTRTIPSSTHSSRIPFNDTIRTNSYSIQVPSLNSADAKSRSNFPTSQISRSESTSTQNRLLGNRQMAPRLSTVLMKTPLTNTVQSTVPFKPNISTTLSSSPQTLFKSAFPGTMVQIPAPSISVEVVRPPQQPTSAFAFRPIEPSTFISNIPQATRITDPPSVFNSPPRSSPQNFKRVHDDSDSSEDMSPKKVSVTAEYVEFQQQDIRALETTILKREREIVNLKKKMSVLKRRIAGVRNPLEGKTDEELVEEILSKYLDGDAVQFFMGQMKVSGKTYTQFRWSEEDKLFALGLLYKNPVEYNLLFHKYTLPSDKTLTKFVARVKKAELEDPKFNYHR